MHERTKINGGGSWSAWLHVNGIHSINNSHVIQFLLLAIIVVLFDYQVEFGYCFILLN